MSDSTKRFSNRVENYVKWRPFYPPSIVDAIQERCRMTPDWTIADIGSGPGNLARQFLRFGAKVIGVEPNREMRAAGETLLAGEPRFLSVDGTAEQTGLDDRSVDLVTAGQAFHWFDMAAARREFQRILREPKWVALVWNERPLIETSFFLEYEALHLEFPDYLAVRHRDVAGRSQIAEFFAPNDLTELTFPNEQIFDREGLRGRLLSSSYAPSAGDPNSEPTIAKLDAIFDRHAVDGRIVFPYNTRLYLGELPD